MPQAAACDVRAAPEAIEPAIDARMSFSVLRHGSKRTFHRGEFRMHLPRTSSTAFSIAVRASLERSSEVIRRCSAANRQRQAEIGVAARANSGAIKADVSVRSNR